MGGFHLFKRGSKETNNVKPISHEKDTPLRPLAAIDLYGDNTALDIDFSSFYVPTEAEIKDRGKSDWLAKSLVLIQTSWFVLQCIARGVEHLPITHLEIVTLAYAAMNFVIYIFWWNKPLNATRPVRVFRRSDPRTADNDIELGDSGSNEILPQPISEVREWTWDKIINGLVVVFHYITGNQDAYGNVELGREDRVPRFWANSTGEDATFADFIVLGVGTCFGAIHCIAWDFLFPTHAELLMWRVSSAAITAVPPFIFSTFFLIFWMDAMNFNIVGFIVVFSNIPAGLLYIIARMITLALALTSLRELPPGAYETVHWTTFIPHV